MVTVKHMYDYCKENEIKLLSEYNSLFWQPYKADYDKFDDIFKSLYKTFLYFDQEDLETVEDVTARFITTVYNWLLINDKRYSELYRVRVVDDSKYSILDNYDITEEYAGNGNEQNAVTSGQRTDVNNTQIGDQNFTDLNKVTGYNNNTENTKDSSSSSVGSRNDISQFTKGEETDVSKTTNEDSHNMHRYGNIGVMTQTDVMKRHVDFWNVYNFYIMIFDDICRQFLNVV